MTKLSEAFPNWIDGHGIFDELNKLDVPWTTNSLDLDLEYFGNHSGDKSVSPLVSKLLVDNVLSDSSRGRLASVIFSLNSENWTRLYSALQEEYKALQNYNGDETRTITNKDTGTNKLEKTGADTSTTKSNGNNVKSGSEILSSSTNGTDTQSGTIGNSGNNTSDSLVFGFNTPSDSPVPSDKSLSNNTNTETRNLNNKTVVTKDDTHTYNDLTDTESLNSETKYEHGTIDTETRDLQSETSEKYHREGNLGVTSSQQMLTQEFELRIKYRFFDVVFKDLDRTLALLIYNLE